MRFSVCYHLYSGVTLTNRIDTSRIDRIIVLFFLFAFSLVDKSGLTSTHYHKKCASASKVPHIRYTGESSLRRPAPTRLLVRAGQMYLACSYSASAKDYPEITMLSSVVHPFRSKPPQAEA